jgi:hypothetical protein
MPEQTGPDRSGEYGPAAAAPREHAGLVEGAGGVFPSWFWKWAPPATLGATLLSLTIHLVLGLVAAVIYVGGAQAGGAGGKGGSSEIGVAVITEAEFGELTNAGLDADAPAVAEAPSVSLPGGADDLGVAEVAGAGGDQEGLTTGLGGLTEGLGSGNISGGPGLGSGGGGGAASFFGVEARGTRFAYIVDISGSMEGGIGVGSLRRIDVLKTELLRSVEALLENAAFLVVMFSNDAKPLGGRLEWVQASDAGKQWARRTIPLIGSDGATEPVPAFKMVFTMRPKPDAIYFMTDGEFNEEYALQIARMNGDWRIPIHCITFVSREGEKTMKKIAADSGGTYTHVPGPGG